MERRSTKDTPVYAEPRRKRRPLARRPTEWDKPTVVTMLKPSLRRVLDEATDGAFGRVHADSITDATRAVHEHAPTALLLSPSVVNEHPMDEISNLVARSFGATPIAVLGDDWATAHLSLLQLGACGVQQLVNLSEREGWNRLRSMIQQTGGECRTLVTRELLSATSSCTNEVQQFMATLVRVAPETVSCKMLGRRLGIEPTTLLSRFFRARLPTPKRYLSMTRLVYAAWFLEHPRVSIAAAADALGYSSPQSFSRHIRTTLGLTASEFRRDLRLRAALAHFRARLIEPYLATLAWFQPLRLKRNRF